MTVRSYAPPVEPFLPFATPRLRLRSFQAADAPAFAAYRSDADVARYQSWRRRTRSPTPSASSPRWRSWSIR